MYKGQAGSLVNPEIRATEGERETIEGCLSFPGYEGLVKRAIAVKARWLDENGSKMTVTAEELYAQAIEHEIDHVLMVRADVDIVPNPNEISETRWLSAEQINERMAGGGEWKGNIIAPWFSMIWDKVLFPNYPDIYSSALSPQTEIVRCSE